MIKNKHKVPLKLWRSFRDYKSKKAYNKIMDLMLHNQWMFMHPKSKLLSKTYWETVSHNSACNAAWLAAEIPLPQTGDEIIDINPYTGRKVRSNIVK